MKVSLSTDQKQVLNDLWRWLKYDAQTKSSITLGGYAGTGKTTSLAVFRKYLQSVLPDWKIAFASYTGKATRVLRSALRAQKAIYKGDFVGTIHSLIYSPILGDHQEVVGWDHKKNLNFQLIVIDEGSMVDYQIWQDLQNYDIPIIVAGDHGQLPPIQGTFNLMENPDLKLEQIHRQAANNPIIKLSMMARKTGKIPVGQYAEKVRKIARSDLDAQDLIENQVSRGVDDLLILCGYNKTRIKLNHYVRELRGFEDPNPTSRDRVICLKNNYESGLYNGMLGTIQKLERSDELWSCADIELDGEDGLYQGLIYNAQFNAEKTLGDVIVKSRGGGRGVGGRSGGERGGGRGRGSGGDSGSDGGRGRSGGLGQQAQQGDLFDFGYALTVHKAQGSQAKRIIVFEERFKQMDDEMWRRWLYTAVTRAEEELYLVGE